MQIDQQSKDTPDYLFFNIRGSATTSTNPEGYLVFYGMKGWMESVPPEIYDRALETSMFEYDGGKMKMNMDLDLNGHSIKSPFSIMGYREATDKQAEIRFNPVSIVLIIPLKCALNKILCYIPRRVNDHRISLEVTTCNPNANSVTLNSRHNIQKQTFDTNIDLEMGSTLNLKVFKLGGRIVLDFPIVCNLVFNHQ